MLVQTCDLEDFDTSTNTCSDPYWVSQTGFLPDLPVSDALVISSAIVAVWAIGFSFKMVRRFLFR